MSYGCFYFIIESNVGLWVSLMVTAKWYVIIYFLGAVYIYLAWLMTQCDGNPVRHLQTFHIGVIDDQNNILPQHHLCTFMKRIWCTKGNKKQNKMKQKLTRSTSGMYNDFSCINSEFNEQNRETLEFLAAVARQHHKVLMSMRCVLT